MLTVKVRKDLTLSFFWKHHNPVVYDKMLKKSFDKRKIVIEQEGDERLFWGTTCCVLVGDSKEFLCHDLFRDHGDPNDKGIVMGKAFLNPKDSFNKNIGRKLSLKDLLDSLSSFSVLNLTKEGRKTVWDAYNLMVR